MLRWLIGLAISGTWLFFVGLLVRKHLTPENSSLAIVPAEMVMERFLSYGEESALDVWKGREIVGLLRFEARKAHPFERQFGASHHLRSRAEIKMPLPGLGERQLDFDSEMLLSLNSQVHRSQLKLQLSDPPILLMISPGKGDASSTPVITLRETRSGMELFNSAKQPLGGAAAGNSEGLAALMAGAFGIPLADLKAKQEKTAEGTTTKARTGSFTVLDQSFRGFIQKTTLGPGREFTLYLGETGEVLRMTTNFLDYEFISTELRPEGALASGLTLDKK